MCPKMMPFLFYLCQNDYSLSKGEIKKFIEKRLLNIMVVFDIWKGLALVDRCSGATLKSYCLSLFS